MTRCNALDLPALLARIRGGDHEAFAPIVDAYQGPVRACVAMMGVEAWAVDEIAQEVFIEVFQHLDRYDPARPMLPWLRGFVRNCVRRMWSKRRSYAPVESVVETLVAEEETEEPAWIPAAMERLSCCLEHLEGRGREIVHLRYWEGLNATTIASRLGLTPVTVRVGLGRIRERLRLCLERGETE